MRPNAGVDLLCYCALPCFMPPSAMSTYFWGCSCCCTYKQVCAPCIVQPPYRLHLEVSHVCMPAACAALFEAVAVELSQLDTRHTRAQVQAVHVLAAHVGSYACGYQCADSLQVCMGTETTIDTRHSGRHAAIADRNRTGLIMQACNVLLHQIGAGVYLAG